LRQDDFFQAKLNHQTWLNLEPFLRSQFRVDAPDRVQTPEGGQYRHLEIKRNQQFPV
jgi:hypothetical protein